MPDSHSQSPEEPGVHLATSSQSVAKEPWFQGLGLFAVALWAGLISGMGEALEIRLFQHFDRANQRLMGLGHSWQVVWAAPLWNLLCFAALAIIAIVVGRFVLPRLVARTLLWILLALMVFDWLAVAFYGRIGLGAIMILAFGIATMVLPLGRRFATFVFGFCRRRWFWPIAITIGLMVAIRGGMWLNERLAVARLPKARPNAPHILMVVIDTLRADHLRCYGYYRPTSPAIDAFALQGTLFESCIAASSWTPPSHASMLTGLTVHEHKTDVQRMDGDFPTLPGVLTQWGYRTGGFSANLGYFSQRQGLHRGFQHFEDQFFSIDDALVRTVFGRAVSTLVFGGFLDEAEGIYRRDAASVNASYLAWLDQYKNHPTFAVLNYMDVHGPYVTPGYFPRRFSHDGAGTSREEPADENRWIGKRGTVSQYDDCVAYADQCFGQLLQALKERGMDDNTLVMVTSDHGEFFGEHELGGHGNALYFPVIHVPLVMRWAGHVPQGRRIARPVSNKDLAATISSRPFWTIRFHDSGKTRRLPPPGLRPWPN